MNKENREVIELTKQGLTRELDRLIEDQMYYRIYEIMEYHTNILGGEKETFIQEYVHNITKENCTGNSIKACYDVLIKHLVNKGN